MRSAPDPTSGARAGVLAVLLLASACCSWRGRAQEPSRSTSLTSEQRQQLQQARALGEKTRTLYQQGKLNEAVEAWKKKLTLERAVWVNAPANLIPSLERLAQLHQLAEDYPPARKALREVLAIQTKLRGPRHWRVTDARQALADVEVVAALDRRQLRRYYQARELNGQVADLYRQGKVKQALPLAEQVLQLTRSTLGARHPHYAACLGNLAEMHRILGRYDRAEPLYREALAIVKRTQGENHPNYAATLNNLAELYRGRGEYARAEPLYRQALGVTRQAFGDKDPEYADSLNNLAGLYRLMSRYTRARPLYQQALAVYRLSLGEKHPRYANSLNSLALLDTNMGDYARAEPLYRQALAIVTQALGKKHPLRATILNNLALLYKATGAYARAEPLYRQSLEITREAYGEEHPEYLTTLDNLAMLYLAQGDYVQAEKLLQQVLELGRQILGEKHPRYAAGLSHLAKLHLARGDYARAEPLLQKVLQISKQALGEKHPAYASALNNLGALYEAQGDYPRAEAVCRQALEVSRQALGTNHPEYATGLNNLATLYLHRAAYAQAEPLYREALEVTRRTLGDQHPEYATSLANLAVVYRFLGDYDRAEKLFQQARDITKRTLGEKHPAHTSSLTGLGVLYQQMGDDGRAEPLFRQVLKVRQETLGERHPSYARILKMLGDLHQRQGDYRQAEKLYRQALDIAKQTLGKKHPTCAAILNNLAALCCDQGAYDRAEPLLEEVLANFQQTLGTRHPHYAAALENLAAVYTSQGRWGRAARAMDRARRSLHEHITRVLPGLPEAEQLAFLRQEDRVSFSAALSLARRRPTDPGMADRSAAWLLNGKALGQQALAQPLLLARNSKDPRLAGPFQKLLKVRTQLANLTFAPLLAGQEDRRKDRLAALAQSERDLVKQLGQESDRYLADPPWVELDAVRKALPADAVLIDIAWFPVLNFQARGKKGDQWQEPHYVAWVIPPAGKGAVQIVDLGTERVLDAAILKLQVLPDSKSGVREAQAEEELRQRLGALARLVLRPLAPHIGQARRWIISSDALLWLVPWAALPLPDGRYAVEKHCIQCVVSGRDLAAPAAKVNSGRPLVLADPDFDRSAAREGGGNSEGRGRLPAHGLPRFTRLLGTAAEAQAIAPLLKQYAGIAPAVYTGRQALESVFKTVRRPRVVVLSTHGFFLPDQTNAVPVPARGEDRGLKLVAHRRPRPRSRKAVRPENPLLRCGLALAGANQRDQAAEGAEDGILTGLEVVGTDLRGCELVVLSACETGLGRVRNSEGVAGLRQAFQLAGAQAVVATLWQVPDRETTVLMKSFFTHLAARAGRAEALRQAQLDLIKQRRAWGKAAHPFYWAAFTLSGDGR